VETGQHAEGSSRLRLDEKLCGFHDAAIDVAVGRRSALEQDVEIADHRLPFGGHGMTAARQVTGYSATQIALHWADGVEASWRAFSRGETAPPDAAVLTYLHIGTGVLIGLLIAARLYLRLIRGAPKPPADEPRILQIVAEAIHGLIYLLLFLLPLSGMVAWFAGAEGAAAAHVLFKTVLLAAIVLHVAGALFQHFVRRSDVLMRMLRPQPD
jgi:cytochrome b561